MALEQNDNIKRKHIIQKTNMQLFNISIRSFSNRMQSNEIPKLFGKYLYTALWPNHVIKAHSKQTQIESTHSVSSTFAGFKAQSHFVYKQYHVIFLLKQKYLTTLCPYHVT